MKSSRSPSQPLFYLAYGSNLHPLRLQQRLSQCELIARIEIPSHRLYFHKRGEDNSGKCDLIFSTPQDRCFGALYQIATTDAGTLDRFESGYHRRGLTVEIAAERYQGFTYQADKPMIAPDLQPFGWYLALITSGAEFLGFSAQYLQQLERTSSRSDPHPTKAEQHRQLVRQLQLHNRRYPAPTIREGQGIDWDTV